MRDRGSVSYNAAVESAASRDTDPQPAAFAQRVQREAIRRGFDTAAQRVVIGDGAAWIWNLAAEQFPGAIEIVDIYHAKQHLCDVGKAIYGPGTDLADRWASDRRAPDETGRLDAAPAAMVASDRMHPGRSSGCRRPGILRQKGRAFGTSTHADLLASVRFPKSPKVGLARADSAW